jgi:hypothetical protein
MADSGLGDAKKCGKAFFQKKTLVEMRQRNDDPLPNSFFAISMAEIGPKLSWKG